MMNVGAVQKENSAGVQKETLSQKVISQDFRPVVLGWKRRLCPGPELAERMMDQGMVARFVGAMGQLRPRKSIW
jgi:hypothetical protein